MDKQSLQAYVSEDVYEWLRLKAFLKKESISATTAEILQILMEREAESSAVIRSITVPQEAQ